MIVKLAWKNCWRNKFSSILSIILISISILILSSVYFVESQIDKQFNSNLDRIDMVLGASGSPLQLILSSVFHLDNPTGNINFEKAKKWMNHPFIDKAIPLAYGDSYNGIRIIGTDYQYFKHYKAKLHQGNFFNKDFEVVLGSLVAKNKSLKIGNTFYSSHGNDPNGEVHKEKKYKVVGILEPTEKVIDQLIISNIPSVWRIHENHENLDHDKNNLHAKSEDLHESYKEDKREITAVLMCFRNPMAIIQFPRLIKKKNPEFQIAIPINEVNRLLNLIGFGLEGLKFFCLGILIISAFSIFISILNNLKDRQYELAILRSMGISRLNLFLLIQLEAIILSITGFLIGLILSKCAIFYISAQSPLITQVNFLDIKVDLLLGVFCLIAGLIAGLIPALKIYFIRISKILSYEN